MAARIREVIVDCHAPDAVAGFWAGALGRVVQQYPGGVHFLAAADEDDRGPLLVFVPERAPRAGRNRLRLAIGPADGTLEDEVTRLTALGATVLESGEGGVPFVMLADPEGNEICVLGAAQDAAGTEP